MATYEVVKGMVQGKKVGETVEMDDKLALKYGRRYLKPALNKKKLEEEKNSSKKLENNGEKKQEELKKKATNK